MKRFYLAEVITRAYTDYYDAQEDPMQPGEYIKPDLCTENEPLAAPEGKYNYLLPNLSWELRDDTRGIWYKPDRQTVEITELTTAIDPSWSRTLPAKTIETLRSERSIAMDQACTTAIYAGFSSSALGTVHHYPAKDKDQSNLVASVTESLYPGLPAEWVTPFWCANAVDEWAYRPHSVGQIQQVGQDGKAAIVAALTRNALLQEQIKTANAETLPTIVWPVD